MKSRRDSGHRSDGTSTRGASSLDAQTRAALTEFLARLQDRYGPRLHGMVLFGSRARGDHRPDSDVDVAVFMGDTSEPIREQMDMAEEAYKVFLVHDLYIQPWVLKGTAEEPDVSYAEGLVRTVIREGICISRSPTPSPSGRGLG